MARLVTRRTITLKLEGSRLVVTIFYVSLILILWLIIMFVLVLLVELDCLIGISFEFIMNLNYSLKRIIQIE